MTWTADEIRQLRYRLGWSQAEMARCLQTDLATVMACEAGRQQLADECRATLLNIYHQAESFNERMQRVPVAEAIMKSRGLCQITDFEVIDSLNSEKGKPGNA